jgi:alkyldihydroxyacetonephosphate synthase
MRWWGWGDPGEASRLGPRALSSVAEALGCELTPMPPVALARVAVQPSRLSATARSALRSALGAERVIEQREQRILHATGKGYLDLVRLRAGAPEGMPDAVLRPRGEDELRAALAACSEHRVAVVPFGGGTSVVGGLAPLRGELDAVVSLDLGELRSIVLDRESLSVTAGAGLRVIALEQALAREQLTLGHFPQSYEYVTLGGCAATRSAGQASSGYGRFEEMVLGARLIAPAGELTALALPATAAGPDLRETILGSEGALGVISSLTLRVRRAPEQRSYEGFLFESFDAGVEALRQLAQDGPKPTVARLSDAPETAISLRLADSGGGLAHRLGHAYVAARSAGGRCLAILGFEGSERDVALSRAAASSVARRHGALRLGRRGGEAWRATRFGTPYLRDDLMSSGVLVETLETATSWTRLRDLHASVASAISRALHDCGTPGLVGCHVSHVYPTGASLYFTFIARRRAGGEEEQWSAAKRAACEAIVAGAGTISHHHGVGRDHAPWLAREVGADGVAVLRAMKRRLDPHGVMNPGKLLLEATAQRNA